MRVLIFVPALMLIPPDGLASPGLSAVAVYMSSAVEITEKMVETCALRHPSLAARGAAALQAWRSRNASDALKAAEKVEAELQRAFPTSSDSQAALQRLDELKRDHLDARRREVDSSGMTTCDQFVSTLESPDGDLARVLPK